MTHFIKKKKAYLPMKRGISIIELLVVITVLGIIFAIVIPQFSKNRELQVLKSGVEDVLSSINKAHSQTLASLNSSEYGVHFQSDEVIIFKGTVFSDSDISNEAINLTAPANISNVTINGVSGVSGDIYFNRLSGVPSNNGINTITISVPSGFKIITISVTGVTSVN